MTPAELREQSRLSREAALQETTLEIKRRLASQAFALAQLAEKIEREEAARKPPPTGQQATRTPETTEQVRRWRLREEELRVGGRQLYHPFRHRAHASPRLHLRADGR